MGASERTAFRKVWPFKTEGRREEKISQVVSHLQKRDACQKAKEDLPLQGNGRCQCGPKPTNVKTFTKRSKAAEGGYMGSFIRLNVDGRTIGNPSLKKYYKGMI